MDYENLLKIDNEIKNLSNNTDYYNLESKIINLFSNSFTNEDLKKLSLLNKKVDNYIDFIYNSGEFFFSEIVLKRVAKLKKTIYSKTQEAVDYNDKLPSYREDFIDLKKYAYALDYILSEDEKDLEKLRKNLVIISEIKKSIDDTKQKYKEDNIQNAKQLIEYSNLLNDFIKTELNKKYVNLKKYQRRLNFNNNKSSGDNINNKQKIYNEEINNAIKDCIDVLNND